KYEETWIISSNVSKENINSLLSSKVTFISMKSSSQFIYSYFCVTITGIPCACIKCTCTSNIPSSSKSNYELASYIISLNKFLTLDASFHKSSFVKQHSLNVTTVK